MRRRLPSTGQRGLFHAQSDLPSLRGKFLNRLKYDRIPIWENKQRIKDLTFWRDLWLQGTSPDVKVLISPATGKPFGVEERRGELNRRIPLVREIVALADISTVRDWKTVRKDAGTVR